MALPDWRLPKGVSRGAWDYAQSSSIAEQYDAFHAENPLFAIEHRILAETFGEPDSEAPGVIADFGCGSGRALLPLVQRGWRGLAIDLSEAMLDVVRRKAEADSLAIECVAANLVGLGPDLVADGAAHHGMCLFSTLGMIAGRENRLAALRNLRRVVRPGGSLVLHAHNFWFNLRDPAGPWWAIESWLRGGRGGYETGDRTYPYRGVPNFFLHAYRRRELRRDLAEAGWRVERQVPLAAGHHGELRTAWFAPALRTQGWIVVCRNG